MTQITRPIQKASHPINLQHLLKGTTLNVRLTLQQLPLLLLPQYHLLNQQPKEEQRHQQVLRSKELLLARKFFLRQIQRVFLIN